MTIGEKIQSIRKKQKITQKELSEKCGCSVISIGRYESGERSPSWESIQKIAAALEVTTNDLIAGTDIFCGDLPKEDDFAAAETMKADTIAKYDRLNDLGKEKANEYITDLSENPKYTQ